MASDFPRTSPTSTDETETLRVSATEVADAATRTPKLARYVVLGEIGRGSMGRVLRAYDPKLQREVALKQVRFGPRSDTLQTGNAAQRLVREARSMAKLSHPNVVSVYDVELLDSGAVVLVMEYVDGSTLRGWLQAQERSWSAVVERFIAAGRGLAAAHQAGLLHRDFKPANVLVTENAVKVTDFGLAKPSTSLSYPHSSDFEAADDDLTEVGTVLGTPRYMAPEQFKGAPEGPTSLGPAADQYSFCIALWEALCGAPPFSGPTMVQDKFDGPPVWPNPATPRELVGTIVRGLSVNPEDRWSSMDALLEALSPAPRPKQGRRWALGLSAAALIGAGVWAVRTEPRCRGAADQLRDVWGDTRRAAVREAMLGTDRLFARQAWAHTDAELQGYAGEWVAMHTEACEATAVRGEQSSEVLDLRMICLRHASENLETTVDLLTEADAAVVSRAHVIVGSLPPLSRCEDIEVLIAEDQPPPTDEVPSVDAARKHLARSTSLVAAGRFGEARVALEHARTELSTTSYRPMKARLGLKEATVFDKLGDATAAENSLGEALEHASKAKRWSLFGQAARYLVYVVGVRQRRAEAGIAYRRIAAGIPRSKREELTWRNLLGTMALVEGRYAEAEGEFRAALKAAESELESDQLPLAQIRNNIGQSLARQGKADESEAIHREVLALQTRVLGPNHPETAITRSSLGMSLEMQGSYAEAEAEHRAVLEILAANLGPEHVELAQSHNNLGNALYEQGKRAEAEVEYRRALELREKVLGPEHPLSATCRLNLASVLSDQGKKAEAEAAYRSTIKDYAASVEPDHPHLLLAELGLAELLLESGDSAEAMDTLRRIQPLTQRDDLPAASAAGVTFALARGSWSTDGPRRDRVAARSLAEQARRDYASEGTLHTAEIERIDRWLDEHPPN